MGISRSDGMYWDVMIWRCLIAQANADVEANGQFLSQLLGWALVAVVCLFVIAFFIRIFLSRQDADDPKAGKLVIDLDSLRPATVRESGSVVEYYSTPIRIMAVVLAPAGRGHPLPTVEEYGDMFENLVPGLARAVLEDKPIIRVWPVQLSTAGFAQAFFNNVALPGDKGKGTPWCSLAGRFQSDDRQILIGFACRTDKADTLSQMIVEQDGQWRDVLRVRET